MAVKEFPVRCEARPRRFTRRQLAEALLSGIAAGAVAPLFPALHPIRRLLVDGEALDAAEAGLSAGPANGSVLSASQLGSLSVFAEGVVPGSREAQAAEFINLLLGVEAREPRDGFLSSLAALEGASRRRLRKGLAALRPAELRDLLADVSSSDSPLQADFLNLRHWIAGAYYSSEMGMRELGWTPDRVFPVYPSCAHPEGHS